MSHVARLATEWQAALGENGSRGPDLMGVDGNLHLAESVSRSMITVHCTSACTARLRLGPHCARHAAEQEPALPPESLQLTCTRQARERLFSPFCSGGTEAQRDVSARGFRQPGCF